MSPNPFFPLSFHQPLLFLSVTVCSFVGLSSVAHANTIANIGFPRYSARDSPEWLAGMHAAIHEANSANTVPGYSFNLLLADLPECPTADPNACVADAMTHGADFLDLIRNGSMIAVMTPDWWIAAPAVEAAAALKIPIITPKTFDFGDTEHVIHLGQRVAADIPHTIAYMLGAHDCARSGIIATELMYTMDPVYDMQRAYAYGGYPSPPYFMTNGTDDELREFVLGEDPDRLCYQLLITIGELYRIMRALSVDPRFSTSKYKFFSYDNIQAGRYELDGSSAIFDSLYVTKHVPTMESNTTGARQFLAAYGAWMGSGATYAADISTFLPSDVVPAGPSEPSYITYVYTRYVVELFKRAAATKQNGALPTGSELIDLAYSTRVAVGGFWFHPLVRECPDIPAYQNCFCNVAGKITYTFRVNGTTGLVYQVYDDRATGQVGVADTLVPYDRCAPDPIDLYNYPLTMAVVVPDIEVAYASTVQGVLGILNAFVTGVNTMDPAPSRPFRIVMGPSNVTIDKLTNALMETVNLRSQPFLTVMTMGAGITRSSSLLMFPHSDLQLLEDRPLKAYESGDENVVESLPTVADNLHALMSYYSANQYKYTSLAALAPSHAEAVVMIKSINTFQYDLTVQVVTDPAMYASALTALCTASARPFILVSALNNDVMTSAVLAVQKIYSTSTVAISTYEGNIVGNDIAGLKGEVLFSSFLPEWWPDTAPLKAAIQNSGLSDEGAKAAALLLNSNDPGIMFAAVMVGISRQITLQASYASATAAQLLYQLGTVSMAEVVFGPYSNATCTAEQIASNDRARSCQCYKSPRTFYVHSMLNFIEGTYNTNTGRYRYVLSTCGVVYAPYVPPAAEDLSSGAIAGIVVGIAAFVIGIIVIASLSFCCFFAKKHRHAPTDSSKPFAMVFTDIQNSTGLWARAPAQMSGAVSQHHDIIRGLIKKHSGYEVKTIGDSFMVAFKSVDNAAKLAIDIQSSLFDAEWPSEIDANYMELITEAAICDQKLSCMLAAGEEEYVSVWKGIRVRVGVHYGIGDIRKDPVSMGYDYYGTIVNTAARVEGVGHGGQVLLTEDAFQALSPDFATLNKLQVIDLGPQPLRGLDSGVQLRQLLPDRFRCRRFPPLRLDVEHVVVVEGDHSDTSHSATTDEKDVPADQMALRLSNAPGTKMEPELMLTYYYFLAAGLSATEEKWRRRTIKEWASAWNIDAHTHTKAGTMRTLMQLVVKMDRAARQHSRNNNNTHRSGSRRNSGSTLNPTLTSPLGVRQATDASLLALESHHNGFGAGIGGVHYQPALRVPSTLSGGGAERKGSVTPTTAFSVPASPAGLGDTSHPHSIGRGGDGSPFESASPE